VATHDHNIFTKSGREIRILEAGNARARGYRTNRNLITMAYLIAGKLKYNLPT